MGTVTTAPIARMVKGTTSSFTTWITRPRSSRKPRTVPRPPDDLLSIFVLPGRTVVGPSNLTRPDVSHAVRGSHHRSPGDTQAPGVERGEPRRRGRRRSRRG